MIGCGGRPRRARVTGWATVDRLSAVRSDLQETFRVLSANPQTRDSRLVS